jgi:predicted ribosomally synthesized peptide with SipW-like signal peptide
MKTKILICVLAIGLAVALIGGSTAAWFTDDAGITAAEFSKGTVEVSAEGPECYPAPKKSLGNVKPGDCRNIEWTIINKGTKDVELRVKLEGKWLVEEGQEQLSTDNVYYAPPKDSGWEIYYEESGEDKGIWLYYTQGPVQGTFGLEDEDSPASVPLPIIVAFDLYSTDNEYQGKTFELSGTVYAIQASNEAPSAVWDEAWDEVMDADYEPSGLAAEYLEYIKDTKCWNGGEDDDDENNIVSYNVKTSSTKINKKGNRYEIHIQIEDAKGSDNEPFTGTADVKVWYEDIGRENWEHTFTGEQFNNGNTKNLHTPDMEFDLAPSTDKENIRVEINGIVKDGNNKLI